MWSVRFNLFWFLLGGFFPSFFPGRCCKKTDWILRWSFQNDYISVVILNK